MFDALAAFVEPWSTFYADHAIFSTGIIAVHVLAIFIGGGMAVSADRAIWRAALGSADGARAVVQDLATTHSVVLGALTLIVLSGLALFTADVVTYASSVMYWTKMGAFVALMVNGVFMLRAERAVIASLEGAPIHTAEMPVPFPVHQWRRVRTTAGVSFALWIAIVLLGVFVSNS